MNKQRLILAHTNRLGELITLQHNAEQLTEHEHDVAAAALWLLEHLLAPDQWPVELCSDREDLYALLIEAIDMERLD